MSTKYYSFDVYNSISEFDILDKDYKEKCTYHGKIGMKVPEYIGDVCDMIPDDGELFEKHETEGNTTGISNRNFQFIRLKNQNCDNYCFWNGERTGFPLFSKCVDEWENLSTYVISLFNGDGSGIFMRDRWLFNHVNFLYNDKRDERKLYRFENPGGFAIVKINLMDSDNVIDVDLYNADGDFISSVKDCLFSFNDSRNNISFAPAFEYDGAEVKRVRIFSFRMDNNVLRYIAGDVLKNDSETSNFLLQWFKKLKDDKVESSELTFKGIYKYSKGNIDVDLTFPTYKSNMIVNLLNDEYLNSKRNKRGYESRIVDYMVNTLEEGKEFIEYLCSKVIGEKYDYRSCVSTTPTNYICEELNGYYIDKTGTAIEKDSHITFKDHGKIVFSGDGKVFYTTDETDKNENYATGDYARNISPFGLWRSGLSNSGILLYFTRHNIVNGQRNTNEYCDFLKYTIGPHSTKSTFDSIKEDRGNVYNTLLPWFWVNNIKPNNLKDGIYPKPPIDPDPDPDPGTDPDNPYLPGGGGSSGTGGGQGNHDDTSDVVDIPNKPQSVVNYGMVSLYKLEQSQMNELGSFMWSDSLVDNLKKVNQSPSDVIISLHSLPVDSDGVDTTIKLGNIDTNVNAKKVISQYVDISCGGIDLFEFWGGFMDFSPNTKVMIYLPYIGTQTLNTDMVMNKKIEVNYRFDLLTGDCIAYILGNKTILYQFVGNASREIPFTSSRYGSLMGAILGQNGSAMAGLIAGGVAGATSGSMFGGPLGALAGGVSGAIGGGTTSIMQSKPQVSVSSSMGGSGGSLGVKFPFLIIERPNQVVPKNLTSVKGLPIYVGRKVKEFTGYTVFSDVNLSTLKGVTESEKDEIERLLKSGVYL